MKIKIVSFENEIDFFDKSSLVLNVLNSKLYIRIVESLYFLNQGKEGKESITLYDNDKLIDFSKDATMIFDILNYDINERKNLTKFYKYIEEQQQNNEEIKEKINVIERELIWLLNEIEIDLPFSVISKDSFLLADYLKLLDIRIENDLCDSFVEKTYVLLDFLNEIMGYKLIILVNCRVYFSENEIKEIVKFINYKKLRVLFLESNESVSKVEGEILHLIDDDFEEFVEKN